ncbi:hypothetical protein HZC30_03355 [Candidatus Woesearchaeota archaeon]|nr:hypothetical protein [Candidatus Woesearchaeota archaeon]
MPQDIFYDLENKTVKKVRELLKWANENGERTDVDMLDVYKSWARTKSDKGLEKVLGLIDRKALPYFRVIVRKEMNLFGILTEEKVIKDMLEIGIRGIDVDSKEYFIFIWMEKEYLEELKRKYKINGK